MVTNYQNIIILHYINIFLRFEKYISGKYLGELVRLILVNLANHRLIFGGIMSKKIQQIDSFLTKYVSQIEE